MNCKPALEQLREPDALAVCGGATRQPRASAKPLTLIDGDPNCCCCCCRRRQCCCCFGRLLDLHILARLIKMLLIIVSNILFPLIRHKK